MDLVMSPLAKTWIFDLDGTLAAHNGYKTGEDRLLPGAKEFIDRIPEEDFILIVTSREPEAEDVTIDFLHSAGIRFDRILFGMPMGERILINDDKPSGLPTSYAIRRKRDQGLADITLTIDESL